MKRILPILCAFLLLLSACGSQAPATSSGEEWTPEKPFNEKSSSESESITPEAPEESEESEVLPVEPESTPDEGGVSIVGEEKTTETGLKIESDTSSQEEKPPLTQKLVVPEGYTLARIGMKLEEMKICTVDEFITASETMDLSGFPLLATQPADSHRAFRLEGYLFPDTYEIYSTDSPEAILTRLLQNTESKLTDTIRSQIKTSGYSVNEILTLASIIEKEAFGKPEMPRISSVFHNRLNSGMRLQSDVTITYVEGAIKPFITGDIDRYNKYYNTYTAAALPPGPICNPSLDAVNAALHPATTDYLFFLTDKDKNYYYTADYDEHLRNVEKYIPKK